MKLRFLILFCSALALPLPSISQNNEIDSLIALINSDKEDSTKANHLSTLCYKLTKKNKYEDAFNYAKHGLDIETTLNRKARIAWFKRQIGIIYLYQGNYITAMQKQLEAMKLFDEEKQTHDVASCLGNIGMIYYYQNNLELALQNFNAAVKVHEKYKDSINIANSYNQIGVTLLNQKKYSKSLEALLKALKISEQTKDSLQISQIYDNIAIVYTEQGNFNGALKLLLEWVDFRSKRASKRNIIFSFENIADVYIQLRQYNMAIKYANSALSMANEIGDKNEIKNIHEILSEIYYKSGQYKEAYDNYKLYTQYSDSLINEESVKQIGDLKTNYAVKEKESQMKAAQEKQEAVLKTIIWSVLAGLLLVVAFAAFITRSLRTTRKQKALIEKQKEEVNNQRLIAEHQKELVQEKQKEITDSITYAKRLQEAILPPLELIRQLPDSFVLYQPKDIVAGDFYWAEQAGDYFFIAAADSTGHGVPGAMVSVVCSNALNRSVKEFGLTEPGKILDKTKELVVETFTKSNSEVKDGMDISLLAYNKATQQLQWSGANNPLYYITPGSSELTEIKPDKQPIGKTEQAQPFTTHTLPYLSGTTYYLFTDGFPDQFGGDKGKKYLYKRFKELLLKLSTLPLSNQKDALQSEFSQWKGSLEQTDDVTVIGVRV